MKKSVFITSLLLSFGIAHGETFYLGGSQQQSHEGIHPYYSIGVQYLGDGAFVGAGSKSKQNPREYAYKKMYKKTGEELSLDPNLVDMTYMEFPSQCLPAGHEDEKVFVYYDSLRNLNLDVPGVTIPTTGNSATYHTENLQLPAHPVVTLDSFIPQFPQDAQWISNISYRALSDEGRSLLIDDGFEVDESKFYLESTVRHFDDSELNTEQTMYTPTAFLDYNQSMLYAMGGYSSHFGKLATGGIVMWTTEYIGGMTRLQPYAWWIQAMKERRSLSIDMYIETLQTPELACDPANYTVTVTQPNPNPNPGNDIPAPPGGSGAFGLWFLYLMGFLRMATSIKRR